MLMLRFHVFVRLLAGGCGAVVTAEQDTAARNRVNKELTLLRAAACWQFEFRSPMVNPISQVGD